jgi:hypothetical protein
MWSHGRVAVLRRLVAFSARAFGESRRFRRDLLAGRSPVRSAADAGAHG